MVHFQECMKDVDVESTYLAKMYQHQGLQGS